MRKLPYRLATAALAICLTTPMVQAQGSLVCERDALFEEQDHVQEIAGSNRALESVVLEYRARWDAAYIRQQCEDFAAGQSVEITCLNGKRDWTAIKASIPEEYFGLSRKATLAIYRQKMAEPDGYREAAAYCRSVGAID